MIAILTLTSILLNSAVHGIPTTSPGQSLHLASTQDTAASQATWLHGTAQNETALDGTGRNGTALNGTTPLRPYPVQQCGIYQPAPKQDCINALSQFPVWSGEDRFHPWQPHDPDPNFALGQVKKSGRCRIFINLLKNEQQPTWSWDQLVNYIRVCWTCARRTRGIRRRSGPQVAIFRSGFLTCSGLTRVSG